MALKLGIQTYQILTNDDEVCIPSLSSILLAVQSFWLHEYRKQSGYIYNYFLIFTFSGLGNKKNKKIKEDPSLVSQSLIYQAGETSNLPCDISVPKNHAPNDELMLIMWYREDVRSPIYSIGMFCKNRVLCLSARH